MCVSHHQTNIDQAAEGRTFSCAMCLTHCGCSNLSPLGAEASGARRRTVAETTAPPLLGSGSAFSFPPLPLRSLRKSTSCGMGASRQTSSSFMTERKVTPPSRCSAPLRLMGMGSSGPARTLCTRSLPHRRPCPRPRPVKRSHSCSCSWSDSCSSSWGAIISAISSTTCCCCPPCEVEAAGTAAAAAALRGAPPLPPPPPTPGARPPNRRARSTAAAYRRNRRRETRGGTERRLRRCSTSSSGRVAGSSRGARPVPRSSASSTTRRRAVPSASTRRRSSGREAGRARRAKRAGSVRM